MLEAPEEVAETPQVQRPCRPLGHLSESSLARGCCAVC